MDHQLAPGGAERCERGDLQKKTSFSWHVGGGRISRASSMLRVEKRFYEGFLVGFVEGH